MCKHCYICMEDIINDAVETRCGHTFCGSCITQLEQYKGTDIRIPCPLCCEPMDSGKERKQAEQLRKEAELTQTV
jgi:hypothetical protein